MGQKIKKKAGEPAQETDEPTEQDYEFFPLVYLFSDLQVEQSKASFDENENPEPPEVLEQQQTRKKKKEFEPQL